MKKSLVVMLLVLVVCGSLVLSELNCEVKTSCEEEKNPIMYLNQKDNAHGYTNKYDDGQTLCCNVEKGTANGGDCSDGTPLLYLNRENNAHASLESSDTYQVPICLEGVIECSQNSQTGDFVIGLNREWNAHLYGSGNSYENEDGKPIYCKLADADESGLTDKMKIFLEENGGKVAEAPIAENCTNNKDDNDNSLIDCQDPSCDGKPGVVGATGGSYVESGYYGGTSSGICEYGEEKTCDDGFDNDGDSKSNFVHVGDIGVKKKVEIDNNKKIVTEITEDTIDDSYPVNPEEVMISEQYQNGGGFTDPSPIETRGQTYLIQETGQSIRFTEEGHMQVQTETGWSYVDTTQNPEQINMVMNLANEATSKGSNVISLNSGMENTPQMGQQAIAGQAGYQKTGNQGPTWITKLWRLLWGREGAVVGHSYKQNETNTNTQINQNALEINKKSAKEQIQEEMQEKIQTQQKMIEWMQENPYCFPTNTIDCQDSDCYDNNKTGPQGGICCNPNEENSCVAGAICSCNKWECEEVNCKDGIDNDGLLGADCADPTCQGKICQDEPYKICNNNNTCVDWVRPGKAPGEQIVEIPLYTYQDVIKSLQKCVVIEGSGTGNQICGDKICILANAGKLACNEAGSSYATCG